MKTKLIYIADHDGTSFDNENDCAKYEHLCDEINQMMFLLKSYPKDKDAFENGRGYIQQDIAKCKIFREHFFTICAREMPSWGKIMKEVGEGIRHLSHAGRIISECDMKCLRHVYYRIQCIDYESGKEFGQPYFVSHQDEVKNISLTAAPDAPQ